MKPTITKRKDIRGRKVLGYTAQLGNVISASCDTPKAAIEDVEYLALQALGRLSQGVTIGRWHGHVYIVYPTIAGWAYWLDTFSSGFGSDLGPGSTMDPIKACSRAVHHLAQNLWTAETDDHDFLTSIPYVDVRAELAGWIAFQRAYIRIKAAGEITDQGKIHEAACHAGPAYAAEHFNAYLFQARSASHAS